MKGSPLLRATAAIALTALAYAVFGAFLAPRAHVIAWLALLACSLPGLIFAGRELSRAQLSPRRWRQHVVIFALALRVGALAAPVSLSDDIYRYLWDGTLLFEGRDPYASRPVEVAGVEALSEADLRDLNSPRYYTVYPPLSQLLFVMSASAAHLTGLPGTLILRLAFTALDLLTVLLIMLLAERLRRPPAAGLLYAFHPTVVFEVAAGGHTEVLALPLLLFAFHHALRTHGVRAGLLFGLALSAKFNLAVLGPILLVFLLRRRWTQGLLFGFAAAGGLAATVLPFYSPDLVPHVRESVALYSETFSFNAPLYYFARAGLRYTEGWSAPVDRYLLPWLTAATLVWILLASLAVSRDERRLVGLATAVLLGYLLLSRVVHPWYLLPALALGVLCSSRATVVLVTLVPLSYLRYDPLGHESRYVILAQLLPFVAALGLDVRLSARDSEDVEAAAQREA